MKHKRINQLKEQDRQLQAQERHIQSQAEGKQPEVAVKANPVRKLQHEARLFGKNLRREFGEGHVLKQQETANVPGAKR